MVMISEKELRGLFIKCASEDIRTIEKGAEFLKKNPNNKEAIRSIRKAAHRLEGDSILADEYKLGYLAAKIISLVDQAPISIRFISEFVESLRESFNSIPKKSLKKGNKKCQKT